MRERLPGGRERAAVALRRRGGRRRLRARLAADHGGQPLPGRDGPGLLPPVRVRLQPRTARRGRRDQLGRAVPRGRGDRERLAGRDLGAALGQARARRRRRTVRPLRRVPPRSPRTRGDGDGRGPRAGRDDAVRDPPVPPATRRPRRRDPADRRARRHDRAQPQGDEHPRRDAGGRLRRRLPRGRSAPRQARLHPGRVGGQGPRRGLAAPQHGRGGPAPTRPQGRRLRRREHGHGRCENGEAARRRGSDRRLPEDARADARARVRGRGGGGGGRPR